RIFVVNRQPDLHLERHAVAHAALLTFLLIVLVLKTYGFAAVLAKLWSHVIESAAFMAEGFACGERIHLNSRTACFAVRSQVIEPFEPAALALPVSNLILDKI